MTNAHEKACRLCGEIDDDLNESEYHLACEEEYGRLLDEIAAGRIERAERDDWIEEYEVALAAEREYAIGERALAYLRAAGVGPAVYPPTAADDAA